MKPNIKRFKTKEKFYAYDVNTNHIIEVNPIVYELLQYPLCEDQNLLFKKYKNEYSEEEIVKNVNEIRQAVASGFFSTHRPKQISYGITSPGVAQKLIKGKMECLVLEITNQCNFRCEYCGSHDKSVEKHMEFTTAKKAIDYFLKNSREIEVPKLAFYGGEPLLRFDLLTQCVEYFRTNIAKDYKLILTTNGVLLNKEIISYFVKNRFNLLISLDGAPGIHNRYRKFSDGTGTFSRVMQGIEMIKTIDEDYFNTHVTTNSVLSPPFEIEKVNAYFKDNPLFKQNKGAGKKHLFELVNGDENDFFKKIGYSVKDREKLSAVFRNLNNKYKDSVIRGDTSDSVVEESFFKDRYMHIAKRELSNMKSHCAPHGNCLIGKHKLFVSSDGKFYMCEKVSHHYPIGDVITGIDYKKVFDFYVTFDDHFEKCKDCWALRLCKRCFADIRDGDRIDKDKVDAICRYNLDTIGQDLIHYAEILENNPNAYKKYEEE